jgi:hypothetical protein
MRKNRASLKLSLRGWIVPARRELTRKSHAGTVLFLIFGNHSKH